MRKIVLNKAVLPVILFTLLSPGFDFQMLAADAISESLRQASIQMNSARNGERQKAVERLVQAGPSSALYAANLLVAKDVATQDAAKQVFNRLGQEACFNYCVSCLNSSDESIRYKSANALSIMTNRSFGYNPQDDTKTRAEIVAKWRAWWTTGRKKQLNGQ